MAAEAGTSVGVDAKGIKHVDITVDYAGEGRDADLQAVTRALCGWGAGDISIKVIGGGITNLLFKMAQEGQEDVLVRVFGAKTEMMIERERDNVLFHRLAEAGFGPAMYGYFGNGRIEGWFEAAALEPPQMGQREPVDFVTLIAAELARMHALAIEDSHVPTLWGQLQKWLEQAKALAFDGAGEEGKAAAWKELDVAWIEGEMTKLQAQLPSPATEEGGTLLHFALPRNLGGSAGALAARQLMYGVVFSHNDLLSGNILALKGDDSRVQIIDYEYGGYNYAGFDIGNHWCEYAGFDFDLDKWYPTDEAAKAFLEAYVAAKCPEVLEELRGGEPGAEEAFWAECITIAHQFSLASHFFWGLWAVIQAKHSPIDFDFMQYAIERFAGYKKQAPTFAL